MGVERRNCKVMRASSESRYVLKLLTSQGLKRTFLLVAVIRNPGSAKSLCRDALFYSQDFWVNYGLSSDLIIFVASSSSVCFPNYFSFISLYPRALEYNVERYT